MFQGLKPSKQGSKKGATEKSRTPQKVEKKQKRTRKNKNKTDHNLGSWAPLEIKSSSLDRIFQAAFNCQCFEAWNLQNKAQKCARQKIETEKNRAPKNENFKIMFWPFRTTGHTWFGRGSHRRWGLNRLKKVSYKQKTVLRHEKFSKNRHNSVSRPSPGMISVAKWIIFHGGIFLTLKTAREGLGV